MQWDQRPTVCRNIKFRNTPRSRGRSESKERHLTLMLDTQTGHVKDVKVNTGHPLLADTATGVVRNWLFKEGTSNQDSVEVALKFVLDCPQQ
jgi:hypothetical protein